MLFLGDLWGCLGCLGVFWSVQGCFGSVGGCNQWSLTMRWEVSGSIFYSIPTNLHGALIKVLTFFRRPKGPRCLKYQNVPKIRSFWAIGKPQERFQSWDIRVYFIPVPNDHTVSLGQTSPAPTFWTLSFTDAGWNEKVLWSVDYCVGDSPGR